MVTLGDIGQVMTGSLQVGNVMVGSQTFGRMELGNLAANGISPAQSGWRLNDATGSPIADTIGLIGAASLIASENLASSVQAGSGAGWAVKQTIGSSGANFTLTRQGNILCLSNMTVAMGAGASNYCSLYHAIWTQAGVLVSRKLVGGTGFTQGINWFVNLTSTFINLAAGSYQFRQEFACDGATTDVEFGTGTTGIAPTAEVIQLGG